MVRRPTTDLIEASSRRFEDHLTERKAECAKKHILRTQPLALHTLALTTTTVVVQRMIEELRLSGVVSLLAGRLSKRSTALEWRESRRLALFLVREFCDATGVALIDRDPANSLRKPSIVVPNPETMRWLTEQQAYYESEISKWSPSSEPRKPWEGMEREGMSFVRNSVTHRFIHTMGTVPGIFDTEADRVLSAQGAIDSCNWMETTSWVIHPGVLDVVRAAWEGRMGIGGLPAGEPPEKLAGAQDRVANARYRDLCMEWRKSRRAHSALLYQAGLMKEPSYLAWSSDFRGRIYALNRGLSPQGSDVAHAMLSFAEGRRIGSGGKYLAHHGANAWGLTRDTYHEKEAWAEQETDTICAIASDPLGNRGWEIARHPWRFLRFCFEWAGYQRDGHDFVTTLPCEIDATSSALQIMAILFGDRYLGRLANIGPVDHPEDLYHCLAERAKELMADNPAYQEWRKNHEWFPRSLIKETTFGNVMSGYLVRGADMASNWIQWAARRRHYDPMLVGKLSWSLAASLLKATRELCPEIQAFNLWMRRVGKASRELHGRPPIWTGPSGFTVVVDYRRSKVVSVGGMSAYQPMEEHDYKKCASGMVSNFIHSIDAGILHNVLWDLETRGIHAKSSHDCLGVLACHIVAARKAVGDAYAEVFSRPIIEEFCHETGARDFPIVPTDPYTPAELRASNYLWV